MIAVEGQALSTNFRLAPPPRFRRRADTVVAYLVAQHDVPIYRIQMIGLGEQKPIEEGRGREANAGTSE